MDQTDFDIYLDCLRRIVAFPTLFNRPDQIETAMRWCERFFTSHLKGYRVYRDVKKNLIACPEKLDTHKDIFYLSAHVDTVDADPLEWDSPFSPFSLYEDACQMVARGVSDCKAGVAFELFLAKMAGMGKPLIPNLVFTLTFKEEGAGMKTGCQIGKDMGYHLPVSDRDTFFIVLENNITLADPPVLSFYTAERGNFVIRVSERLDRLKKILSGLVQWNPVSIRPDSGMPEGAGNKFIQQGGHVCSVSRRKNQLTRIICHADDTSLIMAGDESNFSVVPSKIYKARSRTPVVHHLVLSNRSFDTIEDVDEQLQGIEYTPIKEFSISQGMNFDQKFSTHRLSTLLRGYKNNDLKLCQTHNIGASDATIVSRCMAAEFKDRFYPIVMGPGTRSQRQADPPRLTHGKNETFDKKSAKAGIECLIFILNALSGRRN